MASIPVQAQPLATIRSTAGFVYQLTPQDELWAARMVAFEGGQNPADVLWAVTQRQVYFAEAAGKPMSFTAVARSFAQPINPRWRADGAFCDPDNPRYRGNSAGAPCSEDRLKRRAQAQSATWAQLEAWKPRAVDATRKWARGLVDNPVPRAMDFAIPRLAYRAVDRRPGVYVVLDRGDGDNVFIAEPATRKWARNHVYIESPAGFVASASPTSGGGQKIFAAAESFWRTFTGDWFGADRGERAWRRS
jgi:hypothetical protein